MTLPVVQGVKSSFFADLTLTKITTLMTSCGSSTSVTILVLLGVHDPQYIFPSDIYIEVKPGPARGGVNSDVKGVAVSIPIKMGTGSKVAVGRLGSWVGKRTMVADAVGIGVFADVAVSAGVNVMSDVLVGGGVLVAGAGKRSLSEQACRKNASNRTILSLSMDNLMAL